MTGRAFMRIGAGAGYAGDRWEPALELVERGEIDYLAFECLAERTIAREQLTRRKHPERGFNPLLADRMRAVLGPSKRRGVRILSNMGAANPEGAAAEVRRVARDEGIGGVSVAAVTGDDVLDLVLARPELPLMETGAPVESIKAGLVSANAYLGADAILAGLATGADVVMTGRVADPSLFVAPMLHRFGWAYDDYARLAQATVAGHLLECAGQITGGYFADPGPKDVSDMARLGFPFADVTASGDVHIGKVAGSGGRVDAMTCTEQLLYEMHDPAAYITPDCVLDASAVTFAPDGTDRVRVTGAKAAPRTPTYKVSLGYLDGYLGEGQMSYAGINAVARARLAGAIVRERLKIRGVDHDELRIELIGIDSLHGPRSESAPDRPEPYEVRLRVAARTRDRKSAEAIGWEVETLYTNGPAGGAGDLRLVRELMAVQSVLLPRELVRPRVTFLEAA